MLHRLITLPIHRGANERVLPARPANFASTPTQTRQQANRQHSMKTKLTTFIIAAVASLVIFTASANAAVKKWEYPLGNQPAYWTSPDGTGGVAFVTEVNGSRVVVWLDSRGRELYKRNVGDTMIEIVAVNARALILNVTNAGATAIIDVDRAGQETFTQMAAGSEPVTINNGASGPASISDQAGFYIFRTDGTGYFLVRYSFE